MSSAEPLTKRLRLSRVIMHLRPGGHRIVQLYNGLDGLISVREARFLHKIARGRGTIVEIGPHRGKSTVFLALGAGFDTDHDGKRFVSIDPHPPETPGEDGKSNSEIFCDTLGRYGISDAVEYWHDYSHSALPRWDGSPIDLLWIDGSHAYDDKCADFRQWGALVGAGGVIVAHDVYRPRIPDVRRAWKDCIEDDPAWRPTQRCHSIAWTTRIG